MRKIFNFIKSIITWIVRTIQGVGTATIGLLVIIIFFAGIGSIDEKSTLPVKGSLLVISPQGVLVEQNSRVNFNVANFAGGGPKKTTSVHDVVKAIRIATKDENLGGLVIYTDGFSGGGLALIMEIVEEIRSFKASGRPVYAISSSYSQSGYLLSAEADKIYMNDHGTLMLEGFGFSNLYFKDFLDKIEATATVVRVGTFKSFVEPYTRNDMSPEARANNLDYLTDAWDIYLQEIATARSLDKADLEARINNVVAELKQAEGDISSMAKNLGLIDVAGGKAVWREELKATHGTNEEEDTFNQINYMDYLDQQAPSFNIAPEIAVITVQGPIVDGSGPMSVAAANTVTQYIKKARNNSDTKAIVLRINSPGGSAYASEVIRQEIVAAKKDGIPVIASFGNVAASGGYWIAASADQIWSHATTVTGSIGIFGIIPSIEGTTAKIGVNTDSVGVGPLVNGYTFTGGINETTKEVLQVSIEKGYQDFITLVAENRNMTLEQVDAIAQGRIWSGKDALANGLVDNLGGFDDALKAAAELAQLDNYEVSFYREEPDAFKMLIKKIMDNDKSPFQGKHSISGLTVEDPALSKDYQSASQILINSLIGQIDSASGPFIGYQDPSNLYIMCLECKGFEGNQYR